jgi:hypothetical protein
VSGAFISKAGYGCRKDGLMRFDVGIEPGFLKPRLPASDGLSALCQHYSSKRVQWRLTTKAVNVLKAVLFSTGRVTTLVG